MLTALITLAIVIFFTGLTAVICCVVGAKAEQSLVATDTSKNAGHGVETQRGTTDLDGSYTLGLREQAIDS